MIRHVPNGHMTARDYMMLYLTNWKRAAAVLLLIWVVVTYLVISPLRCNGSEDPLALQQRNRDLMAQLERVKDQHATLLRQVKRTSASLGPMQGPSDEYEKLRRRIYSNTKELWYYVSSELTEMSKVLQDEDQKKIKDILDQVADRKRSLLSDLENLAEVDGHAEWRRAEAGAVSALLQRRLRRLQNPPDCRAARKVVCNLNKSCGFGCQLHNVVYCLIYAYATERTLILQSKAWRYNPKGWNYVFKPVSDTCTDVFDDAVRNWPSETKVVSLPYIDSMSQKYNFLPLAIPEDLADRIMRFNGDPASWWIGQILKYILRPQEHMEKTINETIAKMQFKRPIVGVHIRRTDKVGTEAAFHHISEYMRPVQDYYDQLELTRYVDKRRVYLATDDANVLADARTKYPDYEFLGDPAIAKMAAIHRRYTPASLTGLLVDLTVLAACDYLVCTFSSQVGRVAYEMMQYNRPDASNSFASLDDIYYFGGQRPHEREAVRKHTPRNSREIAVEVGDIIGIAGNHWNGYGRGLNKRTNQNGLVPWYKTADKLVLYPFPTYKEVPIDPADQPT